MAKYNRVKNRRRKSSRKRTYVGREFYKYLWGLSRKNAEGVYKYTERRASQMGRDISPSEKEKTEPAGACRSPRQITAHGSEI